MARRSGDHIRDLVQRQSTDVTFNLAVDNETDDSHRPLVCLSGEPAGNVPLQLQVQRPDRVFRPFQNRAQQHGMQFVGRFGAEDTLLNLAAQLERAMPWPRLSPLALSTAG